MSALIRRAASSEEAHDLLALACLGCWVAGVYALCLAADALRAAPIQ